jgi:hypothetical protein
MSPTASFRLALLLLIALAGGAAGAEGYFQPARSYGTQPDTDPPKYAKPLSTVDAAWSELDWLDAGLDFRWRYEYRDDDLRRDIAGLDDPHLLRTRAFLGVREKLDPLRLGVEFEDARRYGGGFARDGRDINEAELIQLWAELHFADLLGRDARGNNRPLSLRAGRLAFEYLDRRLLANNQWRNTTNNFQGLRLQLGQQANDWQLDLLAVQPLERLPYEWDEPRDGQWLHAVIGDWRRWSEVVTLQPFYLSLRQDARPGIMARHIHATGVRAYGDVGTSAWDYDLAAIGEFGRSGAERHRAFGWTSEIGRRFQAAWQPRASAFYGYASGDRDPNDRTSNGFEKYYGFGRPWSANDYLTWENLHAVKTRVELQPRRSIAVDFGYSAYWLASKTDAWRNAGLRDPGGNSGRFMGHELDARAIWKIHARAQAILGYAHFLPGEFPRARSKGRDSDFVYLEVSLAAF